MGKIEILAPAGGMEHLVSAVRSGADAVYLGTKSFNARAGAFNFDEDELKKAVCFAHARGVKVHVTLNTLVTDTELFDVEREISIIANSGADAVIVQDLGVARLLRECCPDLTLHASTQMAVHNLEGAKLLKELGFSRVVLARELSIEEIEYIAKNSGIETEVFVHGALCMSVSGCCYLSAVLGERSGNRGRCAGPCRLKFKSKEREYALSLKDMSHIPYIKELADAGVCSLKIEGRLKRPEYVAAAVNACVSKRDGAAYDEELLKGVFSRNGFTDGYYKDARNADMFGVRSEDDVVATKTVLGKIAELTRIERSSVAVDMSLLIEENKPLSLTVSDDENTITAVSEVLPETAKTKPTDYELALRNLDKTGGTPFFLRALTVKNEGGLFAPSSLLNELRREALRQLLSKREEPSPKKFYNSVGFQAAEKQRSDKQKIYVFARRLEQISMLSSVDRVILPLIEIENNPALIEKYGERLTAALPSLIFHKQGERITRLLIDLKEKGLTAVLVGNIGALAIAKAAGLYVIGGYGLNIMNSLALSEYERLGLKEVTASFELSLDKTRRLSSEAPIGIIAYGRLPLMLYRNCPCKSNEGCGDCKGMSSVTDRRGIDFPVLCSNKVYSTLLNPVKLYMSDKNLSGVDFLTFYLTDETADEAKKALEDYENGATPPKEHTNGLYFRELK